MQVRRADTANWHIEQSRPARLESARRISRAVSSSASSPERDRYPDIGGAQHLLALRNDAEERRGEALALQDVFDIEHLAAGAMSRRSSASVRALPPACTGSLEALMQSRLEVPDAQPGEASLHAVHDSCALADQILALTVRAPTICLLKCWGRDQAAMIRLTAEPTDEGALEKRSVEPIRLRPPVLARHGDARRMDDVGFEAACPQPPSQPEAVTAGLEREGDPSDRPASLHRLVPPPLDQLQAVPPGPDRASSAGGARRRAQSQQRASWTGSCRPRQ
jgi:hypothetical protein